MSVQDISIPQKYILSGTLANIPDEGQFEGQIYYATDTDASYTWDGSDWLDSSVNLDTVNKLIGLNSLNILDLTAQSSLTAGINANFERDIYTDSNGYLNTINTGNTTGYLANDKYNNYQISNYQSFSNVVETNKAQNISRTDNLTTPQIVNKIVGECKCVNTSSSGRVATFGCQLTYEDDTTSSIYTLYTTNTSGSILPFDTTLPVQTKKAKSISWIIWSGESNDLIMTLYTPDLYANVFDNYLVETSEQTLSFTPTKFMIVSNEDTDGTGSVTYDITFDGTNWQEGLSSFTEYSITDTGTALTLQQNLNAGASEGLASAYNWGVLLW